MILMRSELVILCTYERYCHDTCVVSHKELSAVVGTLQAGFFSQRIISHLPLSCVIIFLYLKRRREGRCLQRPMVRRSSGLTDGLSTLRWMCPKGLVLQYSGKK